ncbi:hypothetical protein Ddye_024338 [Dipteronia dyeriana]|uniref:Uncharacterized protein n=1 Tax=Dipteronia dyeriana TaxID=168575 RepID=A0AAD9TUM1_9ROSI|nr:hypothetical protein Ddye_024338 [Dipteronia dyeriana]
MRYVVEEPIQIKETLNFDYKENSPGYSYLTLPESEYNRNLGVFQVRVDFLSVNGKPLSSSSRPCMLRFKSEPIHLLLTFLRAAPLVAGYVSETQTVKVKHRGFMEGNVPTSCLKVKIEQRAEFWVGAGIHQIFYASLILETELPLFKRIIWYRRKTIFIWITMTLYGEREKKIALDISGVKMDGSDPLGTVWLVHLWKQAWLGPAQPVSKSVGPARHGTPACLRRAVPACRARSSRGPGLAG